MKIEQTKWTHARGWTPEPPGAMGQAAQLVFLFGSKGILSENDVIEELRSAYPDAHVFGCSTAGEICCTEVLDNSLVATAVNFDHTTIKGGQIRLGQVGNSFQAGEWLARSLDPEGLKHVLVLSDGHTVNGSDLVRGLATSLPDQVSVTGGLAGDGDRFGETLVFWDSVPANDVVAVVGLYGDRFRVGYGSMGGWDPFGPERLITRSNGNVLYELDARSALELYKKYLGEHAGGLPATGLLFPLSLRARTPGSGVVRTILSISEKDHSMTFAGDVPEGSYARFMKANYDRLIDGAIGAARISHEANDCKSPELALLISCVGRKLVLKQRTEEEVEGVQHILGHRTALTGFYSYGEIAPFMPGAKCELHNQTMTITTFSED